jgi:hypothetical protein
MVVAMVETSEAVDTAEVDSAEVDTEASEHLVEDTVEPVVAWVAVAA